MQLELSSNLRSPVNAVQLNRDLIVDGATGPKYNHSFLLF